MSGKRYTEDFRIAVVKQLSKKAHTLFMAHSGVNISTS